MTLSASQSIVSRFSFSLITNLLKASVDFAMGLIVARGSRPEQYGTMMFFLRTFLAVRGSHELITYASRIYSKVRNGQY